MSSLKAIQTLSGTISSNRGISGEVATGKVIASVETELYEGDYEVTPKVEEQTLETKGKVMKEDVHIKSVPVYETTNNSGGSTVYIAKGE